MTFRIGQKVRVFSERWTPQGWRPFEEIATVVNPCVENDPVYAGDVEIYIEGVLNPQFVPPASLKAIDEQEGGSGMKALPPFKSPRPYPAERHEQWLSRVGLEFERWVNEDLAPAIAKATNQED